MLSNRFLELIFGELFIVENPGRSFKRISVEIVGRVTGKKSVENIKQMHVEFTRKSPN